MIRRLLIFILLIVPLAAADSVEIRLSYRDGDFYLRGTGFHRGPGPTNLPGNSEYVAELYDIEDSGIDTAQITIPGPLIIERDPVNNISGETIDYDTKNFSLFFDYDAKVRNMVISEDGKILLDVDLMEYNRCNLDGMCAQKENMDLCPEDCSDDCAIREDGICDKNPACEYEDPDCISIPEDKEEKEDKERNSNLIYLIPIIVLSIVFVILLMRNYKK